MLMGGHCDDIVATVDSVVEAADSPVSILIAGLGSVDYSSLSDLLGSHAPLRSSKGRPATRAIVTIVPWAGHNNDPVRLASDLLEPIPEQIECFFRGKQLFPSII
jgi:hypothetical protein